MNEVLNCLETRRSCRAYRPEQVAQRIRLQRLRQKYRSCKPPSKNYRIPTAAARLRRKQLHRR